MNAIFPVCFFPLQVNFFPWEIFPFSVACWFFQNLIFPKILSGIPTECQTGWIQIRPDILSAWSGSKLLAKAISRWHLEVKHWGNLFCDANCVLCFFLFVRPDLGPNCLQQLPADEGAQWLSGRVLDLRPKGCGFEPHWRHCVVVLEQDTFILA